MTIELIESKIKLMNADAFHRLGDYFLYFDGGEEYDGINPIGQAEGKQKSRRGTPDTKIKLKKGKYILIQYTTQSSLTKAKFYNKLLEDMQSCFDISKTKIAIKNIERVVLCFNSNIDSNTESLLFKEAEKYGVELKFVNLSTISHRIYKYYPYLAKEYLGIDIDTYQLLTVKKFIEEYEKGGIATPLSNPIKSRSKELKDISESISQNLITVISGKAGVGKTRLAVEAIKEFQKGNSEYTGTCIKNKDLPIIYDLRKSLTKDKEYLFFIDDANKSITHLKEVITFYQESDIDFKLILTIRNYALNEIKTFLTNYKSHVITVNELDDDHMKKIIQAAPFNILNPLFQDRIIQVAKGNPRLAIMTAIACKDKSLNDLANIADIYDLYFQRTTADNQLIFEPPSLKIMGILSFFRSVDMEDGNILIVLKAFGINESDFWTTIYDLHRLEVVDIFGESSVRFSDQILEGYVFYRSFFLDKVLNYQIILDQFFDVYEGRIRYTAIDANNTFGYKDFGSLIKPYVKEKHQNILDKKHDPFRFLKIFWIYLQDETLLYAKDQIDLLPDLQDIKLTGQIVDCQPSTKTFSVEPGIQLVEDHSDEFFELLAEHLRYEIDDFDLACDLLFAYLEKKQELAETLVKFCITNFSFTEHDEAFQYYREVQFTDSLIAKVNKGKPVYMYVFLKLLPHFLQTTFDSTVLRGSRFTMSKSQPEVSKVIIDIRAGYWDCFREHYSIYPALSFYTLRCIHNTFFPHFNSKMRMADWPYIVRIFDKHFDPSTFRDAYVMNQFADAMIKGGLVEETISQIKVRANTEQYDVFLLLDWNKLRRKERRDPNNENWEEYEHRFDELKMLEFQRMFRLVCSDDFIQVFKFIREFIEVDLWENFNAYRPIQMLLDKAQTNEEIFLPLLRYLLTKPILMKYVNIFRVVNSVQNNSETLLSEVENVFNSGHYPDKNKILICFYDNLYEQNITPSRCRSYLRVLENVNGEIDLNFYNGEHYRKYDRDFLIKAVKTLLSRAVNGNVSFVLGNDFIERNFKLLDSSKKLGQDLYLYLINVDSHYDYEGSELLFLLTIDPDFFSRYLDHILNDKKFKLNEHHQVGVVWKSENYLNILTAAFEKFSAVGYLNYSTESLLGHLFDNILDVEDFEEKKFIFFKSAIERDFAVIKKVKGLFKIIITRSGKRMPELIKLFLLLNHDIESFRQINWLHRGTYLMNGNGISAEVDEKKWNSLKSIVESMKPKIEYLKHREFINQEINRCRKWGQSERKRMFLRVDYD